VSGAARGGAGGGRRGRAGGAGARLAAATARACGSCRAWVWILGAQAHPLAPSSCPPFPPKRYGDIAPGTVENFALITLGQTPGGISYKGSKFHRVIENFMVQGGDIINGDGTGSFTVWDGKGGKFADENLEAATHDRGVLSMANSGPNTNGAARAGGAPRRQRVAPSRPCAVGKQPPVAAVPARARKAGCHADPLTCLLTRPPAIPPPPPKKPRLPVLHPHHPHALAGRQAPGVWPRAGGHGHHRCHLQGPG
jgi:hypothetical protein